MYTRVSMRATYSGRSWAATCARVAVMKCGWNDSQAVARSRYGFIPGNGDGMAAPPQSGLYHHAAQAPCRLSLPFGLLGGCLLRGFLRLRGGLLLLLFLLLL